MDYKALIEDGQHLQHHGVKGMKLGKRARAVGAWGKEFGRAYANEYTHPYAAQVAKYKLAFKNGKEGRKHAIISASTNALGYRNKKRLREAGGDFKSYVKQQKARNK